MAKRHVVRLTGDRRADLAARFAGPLALRPRNRVRVPLRADAGDTDAEIADDLGVTTDTVANIRRRYAGGGLEAALAEKPRRGGPAKRDGKAEAVLVALACRPAPAGRPAGEQAGGVADRRRGVRRHRPPRPQKSDLTPWRKKSGCLPKGVDGEFPHRMEDVLALYAEPHDADRPVACFGECRKERHGPVAEPIPVAPGQPAKEDDEDVRNGTANLFRIVEPLAGGGR